MTKWTPEQARYFAAKSAQVRKANAAERKRLRQNPPQPQPLPNPAQATARPPDNYADRMLKRVRKHIDRLDGLLFDELDPQKIDRLASAMSKLSELERQLADRPLPGTKKPAEKTQVRAFQTSTEAQSAPATVASPGLVQEQE